MSSMLAYRFVRLATLLFLTRGAFSESCSEYMIITDWFPDGFRAELNLPVMIDKDGWNIIMEFDRNITVLDVADADIVNGKTNKSKFHLKNLPHNKTLEVNSTFDYEFTVHYPRSMYPKPTLKSVRFNPFFCNSISEMSVTTPVCLQLQANNFIIPKCAGIFRETNRSADSYRGELLLPVSKTTLTWKLKIKFDMPIYVVNIWQGDVTRQENNTYFEIESKIYTGHLKAGSIFRFGISVHFARLKRPTPRLAMVTFEHKEQDLICANADVAAKRIEECTPKPTIPAIPSCARHVVVVDPWPDGFRGYIKLPIKQKMKHWEAALQFSRPLLRFDVWEVEVIDKRATRYFKMKNKSYLPELQPGKIFRLGFAIHHLRSMNPKSKVELVLFGGQIVCQASPGVTTISPKTNQ